MYLTKIGEFCANHSNWEEILANEPYNLKIKRDGEYVIFNYNQLSSDFNNEIVREARGIIFKEGNWEKPVCHAFDKFGNYGESYAPEIDWETATVTEKVDGSIIKVWWDTVWHISTNGTIDAFKAELGNVKASSYGVLFLKHFLDRDLSFGEFFKELDKKSTYIFELVSPYNRVVIPYEETQLYFLGCRNEYSILLAFHKLPFACWNFDEYKIKTPKCYSLGSLEACISATKELPWDEEGYVVDDANGNRIKIKSPAYVVAHHMRSNGVITTKSLINIILINEVEEFLIYAKEYKEQIQEIKKQMEDAAAVHDVYLARVKEQGAQDRKKYAEIVKKYPEFARPYLFVNYDKEVSFKEYSSKWNEKKWEEILRRINSEVIY